MLNTFIIGAILIVWNVWHIKHIEAWMKYFFIIVFATEIVVLWTLSTWFDYSCMLVYNSGSNNKWKHIEMDW